MATIKVKLRPSSVVGRAGTIYYQVTHRRATQQITTNIRLQPDEWDAIGEQVVISVADKSIIQNRIDSDIALLKRIVKDLDGSGVTYSVGDIIKRYKSPECHVFVLDFMKNQIRLMRNANRLGTALNYEKTMKNFAEFLGGVNLPFSAMTEQLIADYNAFLVQRGMVRNSISFYMRIMRAVYNKAVRQKLVEQSHPFTEVYTGIDRTRKRAVSESAISQLYKLNLAEGTPLALARDIFIFSYCTRGMAFVDIAYLRKEQIRDGRFHYARHKTGQEIVVAIEPCMNEIIRKYEAYSNTPYVFPIINSPDAALAHGQYQNQLRRYNYNLSCLSKHISASQPLSSYVVRHTWASIAYQHDLDVRLISKALGHTSPSTTMIYIKSLFDPQLADANHQLLKTFELYG